MNFRDLLRSVVDKDASDLHLSVGIPPIIRINGKLEHLGEVVCSSEYINEIIKEVVPIEKSMISSCHNVDLGVEIEGIGRLRVNIYHDSNGPCVAFRLIPNKIKSLKELGLPEVINQVCNLRRGLVLVTGAAGTGKSTSLASIIESINATRSAHIITVEDPIEFVHRHKESIVNQREIGVHASSFSDALRAALREDPDVILIGEMRDLDTIAMAVTAAETGHLVFATLHTKNASQSVNRIIDVFPPHQQEQIRIQLAESLEMVISQVLVPSLDGKRRHVACEVMINNMAIKNLIRERQMHQIKTVIMSSGKHGMVTLEQSLKTLVEAGSISLDAAVDLAFDKRYFESYNKEE